MERLSDKAIDIINELHTDRLDYTSEYLPLIDASDRLAAYEDTGLAPEEINTLKSYKLLDKYERGKLFEYQNLGCNIDRLRELAQADKDGRMVVHGKWKPVRYTTHCSCGKSYETYHYLCTACNHVAYAQPYGLKYCPNCGAKMDKEVNDDD